MNEMASPYSGTLFLRPHAEYARPRQAFHYQTMSRLADVIKPYAALGRLAMRLVFRYGRIRRREVSRRPHGRVHLLLRASCADKP